MEKSKAYKKGLDFENEVANYMIEVLQYDDVQVRPRVSGKTSDRGYEIDVLAKIKDKGGIMFRKIAIFVFFISVAMFLLSVFEILDFGYIYISCLIALVSIVYVFLGKKLSAKYAWIECKNLKTKVKRNQIFELTNKFKDYNNLKEKKWNITSLMFFSSSGYDSDAKEFAKEHKIICFEQNKNNEFKITDLNF